MKTETPEKPTQPKENKPKWYFAAQLKAQEWLDANSDKYMMNWQRIDKTIVIECYAVKPKGIEHGLNVMLFTYYKQNNKITIFQAGETIKF